MNIKKVLGISTVILSMFTNFTASAVRVHSDPIGGSFTTAGQGEGIAPDGSRIGYVLAICADNNNSFLTEAMFDRISSQAKEDGYKHILLNDGMRLDTNAARSLALNFLAVGWDDYLNAESTIRSSKDFSEKDITVLDVKRFLIGKLDLMNTSPFPFTKPYIILPVDNLRSSLVENIYKNFNSSSEKLLECREYYRTCDRVRLI